MMMQVVKSMQHDHPGVWCMCAHVAAKVARERCYDGLDGDFGRANITITIPDCVEAAA